MVVFRSIKLLKLGNSAQDLCDKLGISPIAAKKMSVQFIHFGKIFLPREPRPLNLPLMNDIQFTQGQAPPFFAFGSPQDNDNQPEFIHLNSFPQPEKGRPPRQQEARGGRNN